MGRSRRPVGRRLQATACPRKSSKNLSQRPIIHRPHPHQKHTGLLGGSERCRYRRGGTTPAGARRSAFGQRLAPVQAGNRGRLARARATAGPLPRPERPTQRASSKARVSGSIGAGRDASTPPAVLLTGQRQGGEGTRTSTPTARMQAASREERTGCTAGLIMTQNTQARSFN